MFVEAACANLGDPDAVVMRETKKKSRLMKSDLWSQFGSRFEALADEENKAVGNRCYHRRRAQKRIEQYYPDTGPLRRELYRKHMACFAAGRDHRERPFLAGNRCGKTEGVGALEMAAHLTGLYPAWWAGRRFDHPIQAWAAGDTNQTTRDILQAKLLGRVSRRGQNIMDDSGRPGTGMIPGEGHYQHGAEAGIPDAVEVAYIKHVSGGTSVLRFKFESGREAFQGTEQHVVWLDEEPPADVYIESLMRTMQTGSFGGGLVLLTFTGRRSSTRPLVGGHQQVPERGGARLGEPARNPGHLE
jgi:phage terminase large subunit-like protein